MIEQDPPDLLAQLRDLQAVDLANVLKCLRILSSVLGEAVTAPEVELVRQRAGTILTACHDIIDAVGSLEGRGQAIDLIERSKESC